MSAAGVRCGELREGPQSLTEAVPGSHSQVGAAFSWHAWWQGRRGLREARAGCLRRVGWSGLRAHVGSFPKRVFFCTRLASCEPGAGHTAAAAACPDSVVRSQVAASTPSGAAGRRWRHVGSLLSGLDHGSPFLLPALLPATRPHSPRGAMGGPSLGVSSEGALATAEWHVPGSGWDWGNGAL